MLFPYLLKQRNTCRWQQQHDMANIIHSVIAIKLKTSLAAAISLIRELALSLKRPLINLPLYAFEWSASAKCLYTVYDAPECIWSCRLWEPSGTLNPSSVHLSNLKAVVLVFTIGNAFIVGSIFRSQ